MESYRRLAVIILVVSICSLAYGAKPANPAQANVTVVEPNDANLPAMPFLAEITSNDVYVRSGPGTNYYYCGKLKSGDKIKVVGSKFSWLEITPPAGSFSWISEQYVQADPQSAGSGTVIGEAVRVYAGSDDVQPMHSTAIQVKLSKGDKVTLLGEKKEGYCKITPPEGAYLWVSNQYVKPLGSLIAPAQPAPTATTTAPAPFPSPAPAAPFPSPASPNVPQAASPNEPAVTPTPQVSSDSQKIKELDALKAQIEAEGAKPLGQQNYSELKKSLEAMAGEKQSFRVAKKTQQLLKTIERYELVQNVSKAAKSQDEQFGQTSQRIESAKSAKLAELEDKGIFAVIGQLKESPLFAETPGAQYYRVVDSDGKTLCFARPAGAAADMDLSKFIDKKVGLVGAIEPHPELNNAVVQFTNIVELK